MGSSITGRKYAQIIGLNIISTSVDDLLGIVESFWAKNHKFTIATPNPELVVMAGRDKKLLGIVNSFDLVVPDGVGIKYAVRFLSRKDINIIPGRKLCAELIRLAERKNRKVFLLGAKGIKKVTPGPMLNNNGEPVTKEDMALEKKVIEEINRVRPDILFVGFGMPKQEKWIWRNLPKLNVGGAMAVGGTFSYLYGKSKLPPGWMEKAGLEWAWRLLRQPGRLGRICNAVVIFPLKVLGHKFSSKED